ncbi:hypothetical protein TBLA_0D03340 [Henningerozyma blattae CBS 6284]|uniref:NADH:flavin oxidoreductase/NADH oxidase N-terminal domain-containing protein n=1 Tax=Henningerozyma blattae (strain ATCC 34711 / CBS 6284 / DSM 70876 / NBRC 10599 / NRRL Y-10934 / UCD 77-7) TaxID=1071380 RepID=I2H382_HENB6|nr:hypothetical protein TBLA_0D03340 [Tetrapisispora blattae CBS 6284]CCH60834.1 hypothetical protein TBLA_0D03340 [Tetrapisispora blattae CBS 6284]
MWVQIYAMGRRAPLASIKRDGLRYNVVSSGTWIDEGNKKELEKIGLVQHQLTKDDINQYIQDFVNGAKNAIECGADGVEIHAANGFLLNQFLDPISNKRTDEYGGSIENRARIILEVVDALVDAISEDKVGIRFSPYTDSGGMSGSWDPTVFAHYAYVFAQLEKRAQEGKRLAFIHIYEPGVTANWVDDGTGTYVGGTTDFIYSIGKGTVIRTGNLTIHPEVAKEFLKQPNTLLGYGRYFISNPDLVDRLENGLPLNSYDRSTFYTDADKGYTDYPTYKEAIKLGWDKQ